MKQVKQGDKVTLDLVSGIFTVNSMTDNGINLGGTWLPLSQLIYDGKNTVSDVVDDKIAGIECHHILIPRWLQIKSQIGSFGF